MNRYFDIAYKSPAGITGTHIAVEASNEFEASRVSPVMLSYGTPWEPEEFTVLSVRTSENPPKKTTEGI
jgi:hypothetical protein